jgi:hypothetical protein
MHNSGLENGAPIAPVQPNHFRSKKADSTLLQNAV